MLSHSIDIPCRSILTVLLMPGVKWMSQAGLLRTIDRWPMSLACSVVPLGILKIFCDCWPVLVKCLLSRLVPMLDVVPLLAAAEGFEPSSTPRCNSVSSRLYILIWEMDSVLVIAASWAGVKTYVVSAKTWRALQSAWAIWQLVRWRFHQSAILLSLV
jgi:hypothetical protein